MGGLYYSINVSLSQAGCWVSAALYSSYYAGSATRTNDDGTTSAYSLKMQDATIYAVLGALLCTWLLSAFLFFFKIKPKYWATFYSTRTGCQQAMSYFLMHSDDASKSLVFTHQTDLWKKIEPEVQEWTLANWHKWEKERPAWFTETFKESVPNHMIPKVALEGLNKMSVGGVRRRNSVFPARLSVRPSRKEGESGAGASGNY